MLNYFWRYYRCSSSLLFPLAKCGTEEYRSRSRGDVPDHRDPKKIRDIRSPGRGWQFLRTLPRLELKVLFEQYAFSPGRKTCDLKNVPAARA